MRAGAGGGTAAMLRLLLLQLAVCEVPAAREGARARALTLAATWRSRAPAAAWWGRPWEMERWRMVPRRVSASKAAPSSAEHAWAARTAKHRTRMRLCAHAGGGCDAGRTALTSSQKRLVSRRPWGCSSQISGIACRERAFSPQCELQASTEHGYNNVIEHQTRMGWLLYVRRCCGCGFSLPSGRAGSSSPCARVSSRQRSTPCADGLPAACVACVAGLYPRQFRSSKRGRCQAGLPVAVDRVYITGAVVTPTPVRDQGCNCGTASNRKQGIETKRAPKPRTP